MIRGYDTGKGFKRQPTLLTAPPEALPSLEIPFEVFHGQKPGPSIEPGPRLSYLKTVGYRAYTITSRTQLKGNGLRKLDPRGHLCYLVGYNSKISTRPGSLEARTSCTRDVIFDESTFCYGKADRGWTLLAALDALITRIQLPMAQIRADEEVSDFLGHGKDPVNITEATDSNNIPESEEIDEETQGRAVVPEGTVGNSCSYSACQRTKEQPRHQKAIPKSQAQELESAFWWFADARRTAYEDRYARWHDLQSVDGHNACLDLETRLLGTANAFVNVRVVV